MAKVIIDDRAFLSGLNEVFGEFEIELDEIAKEVAGRVLEAMRAKVHVGDTSDPHAGETRDSLDIMEGVNEEGRRYFDVGSSLEKAVYEEFGTSKMVAIPFARPAFAQET